MNTLNKIISACCGAAVIAIPLLFDAYGRTAYSCHIDICAVAIFIFFNILLLAFIRHGNSFKLPPADTGRDTEAAKQAAVVACHHPKIENTLTIKMRNEAVRYLRKKQNSKTNNRMETFF